jgi:hypothetical protein
MVAAFLLLGLVLVSGGCEGKSQGAAKTHSEPALSIRAGGPKLVVADFESGLSTPFGTDWRAVNDNQGGGTSSASVAIVDDGANRTKKALKATGKVTVADYPFPFAGPGLPLGKVIDHIPTPSDLSKYQGVSFWVKGDGKRYMLRVMSNDVEDYNFFHYVFTATPDWTLIQVPFTSLVQFDWGQKIEWSGKSVASFMFTNYSAPGEEFGDFTLYIDEIDLF